MECYPRRSEMETKPIEWSIRAVRNEEEDILGWCKQALYFCQNVVVMVDPESHDKTYDLIKKHYPEIILLWQNRDLGDSDNKIQGKTGILIAHKNMEWVVNHYVKDGEWVYKGAPDERFDPKRWHIIAEEIRKVRKLDLADSVVFVTMHNFYPDENHCIDFYGVNRWGNYRYILFFKKDGYWTKGGPPHSSCSQPSRMWWSMEPFYHYNWVKKSRKAFDVWRDKCQYKDYPQYELENPIPNWRRLD